ncbi:MAG: S4 domain-containing protein [Saprospiraceae bacterium]
MAFGFHKPGDKPSRDRDDRDAGREERPERAEREERPARSEPREERSAPPANQSSEASTEERSIGRGYGSRREGGEEAPRRAGGNPYPSPRESRDEPREERRSFGNRDDRGGDRRDDRRFGGDRRDDRGSFNRDERPQRRDDGGGYIERRSFGNRDDRGGDRRDDRGGFGNRDDRQGGFDRRDDRGGDRRDERREERPQGRWDGPPREERGSFGNRDDRGGDRRDDRGGFDRRDDRGGFNRDERPQRRDYNGGYDDRRDNRGGFDRRDDRGFGGDRRDDRRNYDRRDDRGSYDRRDERGGGGFSRGGSYRQTPRRDGPPSRSREWRDISDRNDAPRQAPDQKEKRRFKPPTPPNLDASKLEEPIRLNKFVARSTQYSRRESDDLVKRGRVTVNGEVVSPGMMVQPGDVVLLDEKPLNRKDHLVYILINKPKAVKPTLDITEIADDEQPGAPQTLADVLRFAGSDQLSAIAPIGEDILGLQLVSNDPNIAAHFEKQVPKETYTLVLSEPGQAEMILKLSPEDGDDNEGILLAEFADDEFSRLSIVVRGGFPAEALKAAGIEYERADRLHFAGLTKKDLPRGHWRFLNEREVTWVTMFQQ